MHSELCLVACSDPRLQKTHITLLNMIGHHTYREEVVDVVIVPGGGATNATQHRHDIADLHALHSFPVLYLVAHTDCGKIPDAEQGLANLRANAEWARTQLAVEVRCFMEDPHTHTWKEVMV